MVGGDEAGLRHGHATLAQLRHPANAAGGPGDRTIPACRIEDWPDFAVRGVMLDVSRDRVPSMPTLRDLVDRLAGWKINQLQLYMEHTFAYAGHEDVWRHADPYTGDDMDDLDDHCRSRGVELVANQNTLGHFERWLRLDRYRPLAIAPDGFDWIMGIHRPPLTLDPANPDALRAGLGPPRPAGPPPLAAHACTSAWTSHGSSAPSVEASGCSGCVPSGICPSSPAVSCSCGETCPPPTATSWPSSPAESRCASGATRTTTPSTSARARLEHAGVPFWVCPGTSSWMSISGRVDNMIGNVEAAATAGVAHGAGGLLVTDWGDMGHHQQPYVSDPGFATAAAFGWCVDSHARARGRRPGRRCSTCTATTTRHERWDGPSWGWAMRAAWWGHSSPTCRHWPCPSSSPSGPWARP